MRTSQRRKEILRVSRKMLNQKGWDAWTLSDLCAEMKISLGNLTYYFPKKQLLVDALFEEARKEGVQILLESQRHYDGFESWRLELERWMKWYAKYQYLNINPLHSGASKKIISLWNSILQERKDLFLQQWDFLISEKVLKSEKLAGQRAILQEQYLLIEKYNTYNKDQREVAISHFFYGWLTKGEKKKIAL